MSSTRTVIVGAKTVIISNVPDKISDEQLRVYTTMKIYQMEITKALGAS